MNPTDLHHFSPRWGIYWLHADGYYRLTQPASDPFAFEAFHPGI